MTNKQRILQMVERWPEDISFDEAIYHVYALKKIDAGLRDLDAGLVHDHDEVFDALERECDEEENEVVLVESRQKRPQAAAEKNRGSRRAKNGEVVRKPVKKIRKSSA
jgi:predicted transcriptional regulator